MSMQSYPVDDYGMVLNGIIKQELLEEMYDAGNIEAVSEFTGDAIYINDDGTMSYTTKSKSYCGTCIYYISLDKYPTLFRPAYKNMEGIIAEIKDRLVGIKEEYNIKNISTRTIRDNIRHLVETYFGE